MNLDNSQQHAYHPRSATRANALRPRWRELRGGVVEDNQSVARLVSRLNARRPDHLTAMARSSATCSRTCPRRGLRSIARHVVRYSSDALPPAAREFL